MTGGGSAAFFGAGGVSLALRVEPHAASSVASDSAASAIPPSIAASTLRVRLECVAFMVLQAPSLTGVRPQEARTILSAARSRNRVARRAATGHRAAMSAAG
ncbi:MAG TPA: hypothetical protein VFF36_04690 [Planctomycetota bacterium]|nr:hypothetical protein [Planctomycetota bacterium]